MAKILISAGEASGDVHAAAVTKELRRLDPKGEVFGMGGDALRSAGGEVLFDIKEHGVMGFTEVIAKLPALFKLRSAFAEVMDERKPDVLVIVDYPGFNMKLAALAKKKGIPVVNYIAPSAWAWRKGRAKTVARLVDKVACIFPFEYDVYKEAGAPAVFVGHPLLDIVKPELSREEALAYFHKQQDRKLLVLLPGSRLMEIEKMLPTLLAAAKLIKEELQGAADLLLPRAATIPKELLERHIAAAGVDVKIVEDHSYDLFSVADLALATSGTVTLEAALCGLGSVIVYKASPFSAFIAKLVLNIPHIGLPNIVAGRQVLPELLQDDFTPAKVAQAALDLLTEKGQARLREDMAFVRQRLGENGAVERVARLILSVAKEER